MAAASGDGLDVLTRLQGRIIRRIDLAIRKDEGSADRDECGTIDLRIRDDTCTS